MASTERDHREAVKRIREAKREGSLELDFSKLGALRQLPDEIQELPDLRSLTVDSYDNLGGCQLADISALSGMPSLVKLNFTGCEKLTDLSPISKLATLKELELYGCSGLKHLPNMARLGSLMKLNLSACTSLTDISPLADLRSLRILHIRDEIIIDDLEPLAHLVELRQMLLGLNEYILDIEALSGLCKLRDLQISEGHEITDLEPLGALTALRDLSIIQFPRANDISALSRLKLLKDLSLCDCPVLGEIEALGQLPALEDLFVRDSAMPSLEPLRRATKLKHLSFQRCEGFDDLSPLSDLKDLRGLNLDDCSGVRDLAPIGGLVQLRHLVIKGCSELSELAPVGQLDSLERLIVEDCDRVDSLAPITKLRNLKLLSLHGLGRLTPPEFPKELTYPKELFLFGSTFTNLNDELCGKEKRANVAVSVRRHFQESEAGQEELREIKLIMLGNGRSGKTSMLRALRGEQHDPKQHSTHAIRLWDWQPVISLQGDTAPRHVQVNVWDFGGQQIYHELHRLFMGTRAVFILLWNPWENEWKLDPKNPEHPAEFKDDEYHPLDYWLDQIHAYSRLRKPHIILVRNFMDKDKDYAKSDRRAPNSWKDAVSERYRDAVNIQYVELSAADRDSAMGRKRMGELRLALEYALNEQMRQHMSRSIPKGRYELRSHLASLVKDGDAGEGDANSLRTMPYAEFDALAAQHCTVNGTHDTPNVLRFLHDIGALYYNERMPEKIVLDQRWAIDAFYTLLAYGAPREEVMRAGGRFTRSQLVRWGWKQYSASEQEVLLEMMVDCGVAVPIRSAERSARGEQEYLAPALLNTWQDPLVRTQAEAFPRGADGLRATVQDARLGSEVLMAVLAQVAQRFGDEGVYWRHGFRLRTAAGVLAHVEWSALEEHAYGGILTVEVAGATGHHQADLFRLLRELFVRRSAVITDEAWVVEEVKGRGEEPRELVSAQDLAWSQAQLKRITPDIVYRERLSVGLSYAGQGDGPQLVAALSAVLCPTLSALGIELIDYRRLESEALDDTRRVISAVANSHLVLIFRDAHYLRSINCLCELVGAYEAEPKGTFKRDRVKVVQLSTTRYFTDAELEDWAQDADRWWLNLRNLLGGGAARDSTVTKLAMEKREYPWYALADSRENLARFNEFIKNHNTHVKPPVSAEEAELERWAQVVTKEVVRVMGGR